MTEALFVIDKPCGPSSFDIVRAVKRIFPGAKVGHTGSLDPFASGVLVLLLGKATKLSNCLLNADKSYHATLKLGEATDTMDRTGTITKQAEVPALTAEKVQEVLSSFEGTWLQTPPMYSAKKQNGVRLYTLARQNISVRREPIPVELLRVEVRNVQLPLVEFEVDCSKGTYIRSLADEVGVRLGTVGVLQELRRLSCGNFTLDESITLERLAENRQECLEQGRQNYVRLLKQEGLFRSGRSDEGARSVSTGDYLQMADNNGKSFF